LNKPEAGDSSYETFCIRALNAAMAPVLHHVVTDLQNLLSYHKLTCYPCNLFLGIFEYQPLTNQTVCLTKANLSIINCNIKLDLNLFPDLVKTCNNNSCYALLVSEGLHDCGGYLF
jgi:hypothetical protein